MRKVLPLMALLCLAAFAAPAGAMMIKVPLGDLTKQAGSVLRGRVVSTRSAWTADRATIVTEVTITVNETWKGAAPAGNTVTLTVPGGEVGDEGIAVEHAPVFAKDEDVVLFLEPQADGGLRVSADEQGKYTVFGDLIVGNDQKPMKLADFHAEVGRYVPAEGR